METLTLKKEKELIELSGDAKNAVSETKKALQNYLNKWQRRQKICQIWE
jgi:hypothetical protein